MRLIQGVSLYMSVTGSLPKFSSGKSETETKDEAGNTIEFENITSDEIEINRVGWWSKTYYIT